MTAAPVVLIDASIWIFRAHFALPAAIVDDGGHPAAALTGWASFLLDELGRRPAALGVAFDEALESGFRHRLYPRYKCERALPDDDLARQLQGARRLAEALGLCCAASEEFEADDLIAGAAARARAAGRPIEIVSRDKDLLQLLRGADDRMRDASSGAVHDRDTAEARFGVPPPSIPDVQALAGDSVDGIPGVSGVGLRTAGRLIRRHGDLERLYAALDADPAGALAGFRGHAGLGARLLEARASAFVYRELTRMREDAPEPFDPHRAPRPSIDRAGAEAALASVGLRGRLGRRVAALIDDDGDGDGDGDAAVGEARGA